MPPVWIKICANTNLEDAKMAADLGADAVGFVFAPSPRQVTAEQVASIVPKLPVKLEKIGVFSSENAEEIVVIIRKTGLTGIQLHGGFDMQLTRKLDAVFAGTISIIQTLHWKVEESTGNAEEVASQLRLTADEPTIERVLIDSKTKQASGGTGVAFDWSEARKMVTNDQTTKHKKLIVAGGLGPGNVAEAIKSLQPWGVDVASGVEKSLGHKDAQKVEQFIRAVRDIS